MLRRYIVYNGIDGKALHQPAELFGRHGTEFIRVSGPGKVAAFYSLVEKQKSVPFPEQAFDPGCGSAAEKEQRIGDEQLHMVLSFNDGSK